VNSKQAYAGTALSVQVVHSVAELRTLAADYRRLYEAVATTLPFALHEWHVAWSSHFLNLDAHIEDRLKLMVVRNADGACVAVVPFVFSRRRVGPFNVISVDSLGADPSTTESRGPLVARGYETEVVRAVRQRLYEERDWDWIHWGSVTGALREALCVQGGLAVQGDLEMQPEAPGYVIDLPASWVDFHGGLKRNIRESLRHCYNSLKRDGHQFEFEVALEPEAVRGGIDRFLELHRQRAAMSGTVEHTDHFASQVSRRFLHAVCAELAVHGTVRLFQLRIAGVIVASRIGFVIRDSLYFYYSGFDPNWAKYGVMTTTIAEAFKYAIENGLKTADLSRGTDISKTRWGPRVVDFAGAVELRKRPVSRLAYFCYRLARSDKRPGWISRPLSRARRAWI
jgi:CelD/BcsL family acetyltransferase involved in cellulose biosynthesis